MSQRGINFAQQRVKFGLYLRELRKEKRLTQKKVEDDLGIKHGRLSLIESGSRPISDQLLVRLADKYGVPLEELLRNKYWPQLPLLTGIMKPAELVMDLQKDLHPEDMEEVTRYIAFLLLRRAVANRP